MNSPPVFSKVCVTRSLVLCVMFRRSFFVLLCFFFWSLCCLFFLDIRIVITPLLSSNSSKRHRKSTNKCSTFSTSTPKRKQTTPRQEIEIARSSTSADHIGHGGRNTPNQEESTIASSQDSVHNQEATHGTQDSGRAEGNYQRNTANPTHNSNHRCTAMVHFFLMLRQ